MSQVVIHLPPAPGEYNQQLQEGLISVFGNTWRIVIASLFAFWAGSFTNAYVMAKLKIYSAGKHLWMRTIGSTVVGELVDSSLFYILAFYAIWPIEQVIQVAIAQYILKTSWEIFDYPNYVQVAFLKERI
jgi:hypothetical protein